MNKTNYSLFILLLVGFLLRVHDLGWQSLWLDEAYTWDMIVNHDWAGVWGAMLYWSNVSPLAYVLMKLTLPLFGTSEFMFRLWSAFWGWLAIAAVYRVGRAMFNIEVGLLAAAFVAFSPFAVWYSQDARAYGLYLLTAALALWGFTRAEKGQGWKLYVIGSALLYITHYVAALFVYAQATYILTRLKRQPMLFRKWALAQLLAAPLAAAWVIAFLEQRRLMSAMDWIPAVTPWTPLQTLWNFVSGDAAQWSPPMVVGVLILLAALVWGARSRSNPVQLLLWWLCLPLATAWLFSLRRPSYVDRYFEPAIISVALLVAAGLTTLPRWGKRIGIALAVGGMLLASARLSVDPKFAKEDWRGAAQMLQAEGATVGLMDGESLLGLTPYVPSGLYFGFARNKAELSERFAEGKFVMVLRSPHESIHALSKSVPFDPLTEGPEFFRQWLAENPSMSVDVHPFTGLALMVINK